MVYDHDGAAEVAQLQADERLHLFSFKYFSSASAKMGHSSVMGMDQVRLPIFACTAVPCTPTLMLPTSFSACLIFTSVMAMCSQPLLKRSRSTSSVTVALASIPYAIESFL